MFDRHRLLLLFAATCLLLASGAAAAEGDAFTATSTPSHIKPSTLTAYTVTLTNSGTSTKEADRAKIAIPAGFAVDGTTFQATTSTAGSCVASGWVADGALIADGKINLKRPDGNPNQTNNRLCQGATLTVAFSATSSPTDGSYTWVTELLRGDGAFILAGSQPNVRVDGTAPVVTIQQKPSDPSGSQSASVTFAVNEQAAVSCKLDDGPFSPCTSPAEYGDLAEGEHSFTVQASDPAGNTGQDSYNWRVDATAPTLAITQKPSELSNSTSASFAFTASEPATECKLDGVAFAACSSPVAFVDLAQGPHTFTVKATDSVGNTDQDAYTWTIDSIPPTVVITDGKPSNPSNSKSATFTFTASEPTQCKLDAGAFAACTSPKGYSSLADGEHTFTVKATDTAGNTSQDAYTWTIDATPPTVTITGDKPANPTNSASASFSFSASDPTQCKLDGGAFTACTSPATYTGLADGPHTFTVKSTDPASNTAEDSYTWTVDATAPTVAIVGGPAALSNTRSPTFTFTASEPTQCKLDAGAFAACTSPKGYSSLADGEHTFTVKATDTAGNTSQDAYTWTIDATPPTVTITGDKPANPTNSASASFSFSASDPTQCKLDGGAFTACTSPATYTGLADGPHTFTVKSTDPASNTAQASHTWTVDTTPPTVEITGGKPGDPTNSKSVTFNFTTTESTMECKLDNGAFATCTSPKSYSLLDGQHTFTVRATDAAGNTGQDSHTWTIDSAAPTVAITGEPANPTKSRSAGFTFTTSEPAECRLDAAPFAPCSSPTGYSGLPDGTHTFVVRATDAAGNTGQDIYEWRIDNVAPTLVIVQKPTNPSNVKSPTFAFTVSEGGTALQCKLDNGAFADCSSPKTYSNLADGPHVFTIKSTDGAGNTGQTEYGWRIETILPIATLTDTPQNPSTSTSARFEFSPSRAQATLDCSLDGQTFAACTSPRVHSSLSQGPHTFAVRAKDAAGTGPPTSFAWVIDSVGPTAAITQTPGNPTGSRSATFAFSANEAGSFACELDGLGFGPCGSPASYQGLGDGMHTFTVKPTDSLGNPGVSASFSWRVDGTTPETTLTSAPAVRTTTVSATFTFSASEPSGFECKLDAGAFAPCSSPKTHTSLTRAAHSFEVRAIDAAGNIDATPAVHRWTIGPAPVATRRTPAASALLAPRAGARVTSPPLLRWRRVPRASYYNVQLFRGSVKVLSSWPTATRLQLRARWTYLGRKRRLTAGTYRWYVWPGYGKASLRRYGRLQGGSTFRVVSRARR